MFNKKNYNFNELPNYVSILKNDLQLSKVAMGFISLPAGKGYTLLHSHKEQEEVYVVLQGTGVIQIDKEEIPLKTGDIVRVSPEAKRALKAGDEKLIVICCGGVTLGYPKQSDARSLIDDGVPLYDELPNWYMGNEKVMDMNQQFKKNANKK